MTLTEMERLFTRITMHKHWPWPIRLRVSHAIDDGYNIRLSIKSVDIWTDEPTMIHRIQFVDGRILEADVIHVIRRMIRDAAVHETDEMLNLDGKQICNPHAGEL